MIMNNSTIKRYLLTAIGSIFLLSAAAVSADGMVDDQPRQKRRAAPVAQTPPPPRVETPVSPPQEVRREETRYEDDCEWKFRTSLGVTTAFFDEESTLPMGNLSFDTWRTDIPLNFRVGVEGRHMYLGQDEAEFAKEFDDKTTHITYIRIPFAVEYMHELEEDTTLFLGGGPDIIRTADDISETDVGGHLGARVHYAFDESWGVSVEAGYAWLRIDGEGSNINLDNAYITPAVAYTF